MSRSRLTSLAVAAVTLLTLGLLTLGLSFAGPAGLASAGTVSGTVDRTLSGTVTDGSGHRWPLYAKISISGDSTPVYTDPYTGAYSVSLPAGASYTLTATPVYPGYNTATASVYLGGADKTKNIKVTVDQSTCTAPGYGYLPTGSYQTFTGWTGGTTQGGWTNLDNLGNGETWQFGPGNNPNLAPPDSDGQFALVDSSRYSGDAQDTTLVSPVVDLSAITAPVINFGTTYSGTTGNVGEVDLSLDGGQAWSSVWRESGFLFTYKQISIPIPQAAGQSDVQVRFHYTESGAYSYSSYWSLDNVLIGTNVCSPVTRGGLVAGVVADGNTGAGVNGATVTGAGQSVTTAATQDPAMPGGFYWFFAKPQQGAQLTASDSGGHYTQGTATASVAANAVTQQNLSLSAGDLAITPGSVPVTQTLGGTTAKKVTFTDTGSEPVQVGLDQQDGGFTPMTGQARLQRTPVQKIKGHYRPGGMGQYGRQAGQRADQGAAAGLRARLRARLRVPADASWASIADYPITITDNAVGYDPASGDVYSVAGYNYDSGDEASGYVYRPSAQQWTAIAPAPAAVDAPTGAFLDGKMYVVGGYDSTLYGTTGVYAYDPASNTWAQEAPLPFAVGSATAATLNGQLYVIGGCAYSNCGYQSDMVYRYDPGADTWAQLANYPVTMSNGACAGIDEKVVCAGGFSDGNGTVTSAYIYDPASNTWSQGAQMPYDDWGMAYGGAGGMLQIVNGITDGSSEITNQAAEYNPASDTWSALPNTNDPEYDGGGACGLYQVGGNSQLYYQEGGTASQVLPGYGDCGTSDVPWLSQSSDSFTLDPGQSQTVTLTADSSALPQPGTYTAELKLTTNTPYLFSPLPVDLQAKPPASWGKMTGTLTDASTGQPLAGATVQLCTMYVKSTESCGPVTYTLTTDSSGHYQYWLSQGFSPLEVIAADTGYQSAVKIVKIVRATTSTQDFTLAPTS